MDRLRNPSLWIGFLIAALGSIAHGAYGPLPPAWQQGVMGTIELLGLVGAWFFGAGMRTPAPAEGKLTLPPAGAAGVLVFFALMGAAHGGVVKPGPLPHSDAPFLGAVLLVMMLGAAVAFYAHSNELLSWLRLNRWRLPMLIFWGGFCLTMVGCAGGILGVKQGVTDAARLGATSIKVFEDFDEQHQADIATAAKERGDIAGGRAELAAYREQEKKVLVAAASLNAALAAAQGAIALVQAGGNADLVGIAASVFVAAQKLKASIDALMAPPTPAATPAPPAPPTSRAVTAPPPLVSRRTRVHRPPPPPARPRPAELADLAYARGVA